MTVNGGPRPEDFLYDLLPVVYRQRDLDEGEPMRAIFAIAQAVYQLLEDDIDRLYRDWFVETCNPKVLPYLAELFAIPRALTTERPAADLRRLVANVSDYRRRKGTAAALEAIAGDVTGWAVRVVEADRRIVRTPVVGVPGPLHGALDVRDLGALDELGSPFEQALRGVDVRAAGAREGANGAPGFANVGELALSVWRDIPATLAGVDPWPLARHRFDKLSAGCYTFDPLGRDVPLLNPPASSEQFPERSVPARLANARLRDDLRAGGAAYFALAPAAFAIEIAEENGARRILGPAELAIVPLGTWRVAPPGMALIDVERGRFVLPSGWNAPRVDATWAATANLGGGPHHVASDTPAADVEFLVARDPIAVAGSHRRWFATLDAALAALAAGDGGAAARITIADSGTYRAAAARGWSVVIGAGWQRIAIDAAPGERPVLIGDLAIRAESSASRFVLSGVLLRGGLTIATASDAVDFGCTVDDATIEPGEGVAIAANADLVDATIVLRRAICGRIRLPELGTRLIASESIIDGVGAAAIAAVRDDGPHAELRRCTIFGDVRVLDAQVDESIVDGTLRVRAGERSYARYAVLRRAIGVGETYAVRFASVRFVSRRYGSRGYARLLLHEDAFVLGGAADGGELGAFHALAAGRRAANLRSVLDEYVPYGTRTGVFDER